MALAFFHIVQLGFHISGKFHIDNVIEPLQHQAGNHFTQSGGLQFFIHFVDIFPILNGGDNGCVGRRSAHTLFFHGFNQSRFGIPGRGLGEVLLLVDLDAQCLFPHCQVRQRRASSFTFLVLALLIDGNKAGETHTLMTGAEDVTTALGVDGYRIKNGICHLASQESAPDQLIEFILLLGQAAGNALGIQLHMGGANGFMSILGISLGLEHMVLTIVIGAAVAMTDEIRCCIHGLIRKTQRVGTHIGDQTQSTLPRHVHTFIQLLGDGHCALGGHIQFPGCLLLQGGGCKRRCCGTLFLALFYIGDGEFLAVNIGNDSIHLNFIFQFPLLILTVVMGSEGSGLANAIQHHVQ